MELYFLRHANADWPNWENSDEARPITERGRRESKAAAKFLKRLDVRIDLIVTSPLPRAAQTAAIVAKKLGWELREDQVLAPGFELTKLEPLLQTRREGSLMIVGHEPDFSEAVRTLTDGTIKLSKAGIALVRFEPPSMNGKLIWLVSPREMKPSLGKP